MKVQDIMTKEVVSCCPDTDAAKAAELMWNANIGVLPVVEENGRPLGVVTDRDLFIALGTSDRRASEVRVGEIMKTGLSLCQVDDDVRAALKTMAQQQLHRLPVVDEAGSLQGVLSLKDIAVRAGTNGLSADDVAGTIKAICGHQQGPVAMQRQAKTIAVA